MLQRVRSLFRWAWSCACEACRSGSCGRLQRYSKISVSFRTAWRCFPDAPDATELTAASGAIEYRDINFDYGRTRAIDAEGEQPQAVIDSLSLRVGAGEKITQQSLRASIGMVSQDTSLLHRSVIENIRYGNQDASVDDVMDAARKARADEFIADLEDMNGRKGFDAHVGERGVKLSGGQRQRIAIARVLLKDAPILILDEATSALDSEVEEAIQESL